ncbi:AHH domain-containing protein [Marinoscillum sp.]|uniref:AHH domain-containing protein n=1 Tax=Marinoscillum sp. TaxID=2024838 RepID=UPI003BAA5271
MTRLKYVLFLALLAVASIGWTQEDDTYDGGTMNEVVISEDQARNLMRQLLDVDALLHSIGARTIANDDRLVAFVDGFMERNGIGVLTISYVDSEELWPRILKKGSLKKIEKAPDNTLVAGILFFPERDAAGKLTGYTAKLVLEGKTNEVYELLNISSEDLQTIADETSTEQIGDASYAKPKEAQSKVVDAMIAALQKVEQQADPEAQKGSLVTFRADSQQDYGFDLQTYDQLKADYPTIVVGGQSYPTAWKSLKTTGSDQVIALDSSGQEVSFELDGIPVTGALSDGKYSLSLHRSTEGEGELLAKVGETTVGKLNTVTYSISTIDLKVVPVNGAGSGITAVDLKQTLNAIYAPAVAEWNVEVLPNQNLGNAWDPEGDGLDDGETGTFTNYTDEMNDLIKEFKRQNDRDKNAYYIFLVDKAENSSKLGYMPRKKQWGFVFTNGQSTEALKKTIAHELGHGVYRLEHPFAEKGLPKGQTDNLMDYSSGRELYKYQWDYVHDPASVVTLFDDEEEGAMTSQTLFVDYLGHKDVFVHPDMFTGDDVVLLSPAGKPIQLPKTIIPSFTGLVKNKDGTVYDLGIPRGVLLAFKDGDKTYISNFSQVDGQYVFNGYKLYGSDPASFKVTDAPARTESMVVIGAEDEYCFLGIHSGYYTHANYSSQEGDYQAAGPVLTSSSISLRDQSTQGWIRIDEGCTRDIELATLEPSYMDILKNGFVVVNPDDPNGMMFSYTKEVEGYEAGDATGYIYRTLDDQGNDIYFKWTGQVWERFELSEDNQLDIPPNLLTLAEIWEAVKNDPIHSTLDLAGFIPVIGMGADGLNAVIYLVEGDQMAALLSSAAIISSGLVVGAKLGVRIVKNTRRIEAIFAISDDYAAGMEALLKRVESAYGMSEDWMRWQSNLLELAEKYGDDGMDVLLSLSRTMDNDVDFLKLADEINGLENGADFIADLSKSDFLEFIAKEGEGGLSAWNCFKSAGLDDLARSTDDLEIVSDYMNRSGKSADDVASEIPSSASDAKKWLGDRKIEPFLDGSPNISSASAPDGYQIYEVNGSKYIRRIDGDNPYTPRLMVDENGVIVKYTKPARMSVSAKFSKNLEDIYGALPTNHQRHHLVPDNVVRNSPLHQEAVKRGLYDLDRGGNGRYLAETAEDYVHDASNLSKNYPTHLGSHPNYDDAINLAIDDVFINNGINKNAISELDDVTIGNLIDEIEDAALDILEDWQPSRLN